MHFHTLICLRCGAILAIRDDDEDEERERRCPHCDLRFRLNSQDAADKADNAEVRFRKRYGKV